MIDGRLGILYEDLWDECAEGGPEDPSSMQAALLVRFVCIALTANARRTCDLDLDRNGKWAKL